MSVYLIGKGGREHAIAKSLLLSANVTKIYVDKESPLVHLSPYIEAYEDQKVSMVVIGPETPLSEGKVDMLESKGLRVFGPTKSQTLIESSKLFAKEVAGTLGIPTASYHTIKSIEYAKGLCLSNPSKWVIKEDGLCGGKGVYLPSSVTELNEILHKLEEKGHPYFIEKRLEGFEVSVMAFCDGKVCRVMPYAQDFKRRYSPFHKGPNPNTGGMAAKAPVNHLVKREWQSKIKDWMGKVVSHLGFKGVLYGGFMICRDGPFLIEFNARFGDPETQVVLPLLRSDLYQIFDVCIDGRLADFNIEWSPSSFTRALTLCHTSYPFSSLDRPVPLHFKEKVCLLGNTEYSKAQWFTKGGRVAYLVSEAVSDEKALEEIKKNISEVAFEGMSWRDDLLSSLSH